MKAVVAAFNQEKALVGALSVLTNLRMELFQALVAICVSATKGPCAAPHLPVKCAMRGVTLPGICATKITKKRSKTLLTKLIAYRSVRKNTTGVQVLQCANYDYV